MIFCLLPLQHQQQFVIVLSTYLFIISLPYSTDSSIGACFAHYNVPAFSTVWHMDRRCFVLSEWVSEWMKRKPWSLSEMLEKAWAEVGSPNGRLVGKGCGEREWGRKAVQRDKDPKARKHGVFEKPRDNWCGWSMERKREAVGGESGGPGRASQHLSPGTQTTVLRAG